MSLSVVRKSTRAGVFCVLIALRVHSIFMCALSQIARQMLLIDLFCVSIWVTLLLVHSPGRPSFFVLIWVVWYTQLLCSCPLFSTAAFKSSSCSRRCATPSSPSTPSTIGGSPRCWPSSIIRSVRAFRFHSVSIYEHIACVTQSTHVGLERQRFDSTVILSAASLRSTEDDSGD